MVILHWGGEIQQYTMTQDLEASVDQADPRPSVEPREKELRRIFQCHPFWVSWLDIPPYKKVATKNHLKPWQMAHVVRSLFRKPLGRWNTGGHPREPRFELPVPPLELGGHGIDIAHLEAASRR